MGKRLNIDRQNKLEPDRFAYALGKFTELGIEHASQLGGKEILIKFEGHLIKFYPYTGWFSGKSVKDGRGIDNLLKQIS